MSLEGVQSFIMNSNRQGGGGVGIGALVEGAGVVGLGVRVTFGGVGVGESVWGGAVEVLEGP
jgi:hypothetical protein